MTTNSDELAVHGGDDDKLEPESMSYGLSGHLIDSYQTLHQAQRPFGEPVHASQLAICGPMSYNPAMHGSGTTLCQTSFESSASESSMPGGNMNMSSMNSSLYMDFSQQSALKIAELQAKLDKKLGPEFVSTRTGAGGMKLTYAEGWKIINIANEVFGFNGWSSSIVNMNTDYIDFNEESKRYTVGISAVIRITLRDGVYREDLGYGTAENQKSKGQALDKVRIKSLFHILFLTRS